jgi:8-oxo-dGTP pyrophosphatase MutT (NUDIX family)
MTLLAGTRNQFNGIVVDSAGLPEVPAEFRIRLADSLEQWRADGISLVWLTVPIELSQLIPVAVELGFVFHHADEDNLQLTLSIVPGAYVPPYATHYIGAGGVVLREDGYLLVVSERFRGSWGRHYKLPGGALHPREHISDAVRREVKEETGIDTEFQSLVCFRHWHGYRHGKSDIYFICRLRPTSFEIKPDPTEIDECLWMKVSEYLDHPNVHQFNRRIVEAAIANPGIPLTSMDGYGTPETHELFIP